MTYAWITVTASQLVSNTPACVGALLVTPKSTKQTQVIIYDGQNTTEPVICNIRTGSGQSKMVRFQPYLVTHRGLYLVCDGDIEYILVQLGIED